MNETFVIRRLVVLLLAAGQSSRLGRPKQLLELAGETLLSKTVNGALGIDGIPVVVVLGAHADRLTHLLEDPRLKVTHNAGWKEGMASSIRVGLSEIDQYYPEAEGVLITVCDQPGLDTATLVRLMELQRNTGKPVAASTYAGRLGTPAIFHRSILPSLMQLEGDKGARHLLMGMADSVAVLPFEAGALDIDTEEDYQRLISLSEGR
jgi:molybdenum cofactor cytidylyltransferase